MGLASGSLLVAGWPLRRGYPSAGTQTKIMGCDMKPSVATAVAAAAATGAATEAVILAVVVV